MGSQETKQQKKVRQCRQSWGRDFRGPPETDAHVVVFLWQGLRAQGSADHLVRADTSPRGSPHPPRAVLGHVWGTRASSSLFPQALGATGATEEDAQGMLLGSDTRHGLHGGGWVPFPWGAGLRGSAGSGWATWGDTGRPEGAEPQRVGGRRDSAKPAGGEWEGSGGIGGERQGDAGSGRDRGRQGDGSPVSQPGGVL